MLLQLSCNIFIVMGIIRKTKSVKAVIKEFNRTASALSAQQLVERLQSQMNKSTVYRILERLVDDGILHSFTGKDGLSWYALSHSDQNADLDDLQQTHSHFQCKNCGKTECLHINVPIPEVSDHCVESVSLLLVGKCAECTR